MNEDVGVVDPWQDALLAAAMVAVAPSWLGGVAVKAMAGPVRDEWLQVLREAMGPTAPWRRIPLHVGEGRLLGGLDLAATLKSGRPVAERGLLADCDGGIALLAMAERAAPAIVAHLCAALDGGEVVVEREGVAFRTPARLGVVALDEGGDEEGLAAALADRLTLRVDLRGLGLGDLLDGMVPDAAVLEAAAGGLAAVRAAEADIHALCATAEALGVDSLRPCLGALRVARLAAALEGRGVLAEEDLATAVRLVLVPRATLLPPRDEAPEAADHEPGDETPPEAPPTPPDDTLESSPRDDEPRDEGADRPLEERVLEAARAALPAHLLEGLGAAAGSRGGRRSAGRAGALGRARRRGRPVGVMAGEPRGGARLNLLATLRAAAPWQALRQAEQPAAEGGPLVRVRREDFRITRYKQPAETTTIFVVDASGSSALHRLAEAKGAVERVLADCYVRRDRVALIAFRGPGAEVLLPPTRSLVRAKRSLAGLPGGGGTPLAAAVILAGRLAEQVTRDGATPTVVFLTDGRANLARDGSQGRGSAFDDALAAARALRVRRLRALVIDTSPRPHPNAARLADELGASFLALPHGDALALSGAVRQTGPAGGRAG